MALGENSIIIFNLNISFCFSLLNYTQQVLEVTGDVNLEAFKFFDEYKPEIIKIYECSPDYQKRVENFQENLIGLNFFFK